MLEGVAWFGPIFQILSVQVMAKAQQPAGETIALACVSAESPQDADGVQTAKLVDMDGRPAGEVHAVVSR